jgi:Holliday junction resolvase
MGKSQREKGARVEREMVNLHKANGIDAERVPLSGAVRGRRAGGGHDIDVYPPVGAVPLCGEIKARKDGKGFTTIERWLGENDFLLLKRNNADPVVVIPFKLWCDLVGGAVG